MKSLTFETPLSVLPGQTGPREKLKNLAVARCFLESLPQKTSKKPTRLRREWYTTIDTIHWTCSTMFVLARASQNNSRNLAPSLARPFAISCHTGPGEPSARPQHQRSKSTSAFINRILLMMIGHVTAAAASTNATRDLRDEDNVRAERPSFLSRDASLIVLPRFSNSHGYPMIRACDRISNIRASCDARRGGQKGRLLEMDQTVR